MQHPNPWQLQVSNLCHNRQLPGQPKEAKAHACKVSRSCTILWLLGAAGVAVLEVPARPDGTGAPRLLSMAAAVGGLPPPLALRARPAWGQRGYTGG